MSRSVNCTVPEGKGVLRGDRGCKGGSVRREWEMFSKMPGGMQLYQSERGLRECMK